MRTKNQSHFFVLLLLLSLVTVWGFSMGFGRGFDRQASLTVLAAGDVPLLSDAADLLTDKEEEKLVRRLEKVSDKMNCDIAVYTVDDLAGQTARDYADDIVDSVGLGQDREKGTATLLFYLSAEDPTDREIYLSTDRRGKDYFSDAEIDQILDRLIDPLRRQESMEAFETYAEDCQSVIKSSSSLEEESEDGGSKGTSPFWIFGDLGIGAAIASMLGLREKSKLKTRRKKTGAGHYVDHEGIEFQRNEDIFLDRRVERRLIEDDDDRGEGLHHEAGTTHTSSSGQIHGGGGRKF